MSNQDWHSWHCVGLAFPGCATAAWSCHLSVGALASLADASNLLHTLASRIVTAGR